MKKSILKIAFIAALLVRFFTPSLIQFNDNRPEVRIPFHLSDGKMILPVVKRTPFMRSGFVIVDFKNAAFHFAPARNHHAEASVCSLFSFNALDGRNTCVNTEVSDLHFGINVHGPVITKSRLNDLKTKVIKRIKKDLGIRNKHSKKKCEKEQEG